MLRISKSTLSWGGVAVAAALFMLAAPRAAHAVVAALVQVTNTASSPVIAQGIGNQAAQIVEIECGYAPGSDFQFPGTAYSVGCVSVPPAGFNVTDPAPQSVVFQVPAGETLVVTSVDILSGSAAGSPCMSPAFGQLGISEDDRQVFSFRESWIVPAGAGMVHYVYPSGILLAPGATLESFSNSTSNCTMTLNMHGYLTAQ